MLPGPPAGRLPAAGLDVRASAAAALTVAAEEELAAVAAHPAEAGRGRGIIGVPFELLGPSEFGEPREACLDVAHVQDGHDLLDLHGTLPALFGSAAACRTSASCGAVRRPVSTPELGSGCRLAVKRFALGRSSRRFGDG